MKTKYIIAGGFTGLLAVIFLSRCSRTIPPNVNAVKNFDKDKYLGKWYEIARFDYVFEKNMDHTTAEYSMNDDGTMKVVNQGYNYKKGKNKKVTGKAKFVGADTEAKLKVSFFGPFYAGYNVIAIDKDYQNALVAGKSFKYLWLLSREKQMPEKTKKEYLAFADSLGFNTSGLIWVKQD